MMPSAPPRRAVLKPFWICCGEPSVAIVFDDQPSLAAASATILPCAWQAAAPQLMNTSFLPAGTGLPIGVVTVMSVGRLVAWDNTALAWVSAVLALLCVVDDDDELAESELELLESQPVMATSAIATAAAPAPRRDLLHADVSGDMCILLVTSRL